MEDFLNELGLTGNEERIKGIIEGVLFAAGDPIAIREVGEIIGIDLRQLKRIIKEMTIEYEKESRGIYIVEFNDKIQLSTKSEYSQYIKKLVKFETRQNLSQAALETLAIVAYKQPITKSEIDEIRGVRSDRAVTTLLERNLIKEAGRLEATGRPILYSTTDEFLKYFGFKNIDELPELIEFNMNFVEE
jgi:segregation and condensation protein B